MDTIAARCVAPLPPPPPHPLAPHAVPMHTHSHDPAAPPSHAPKPQRLPDEHFHPYPLPLTPYPYPPPPPPSPAAATQLLAAQVMNPNHIDIRLEDVSGLEHIVEDLVRGRLLGRLFCFIFFVGGASVEQTLQP